MMRRVALLAGFAIFASGLDAQRTFLVDKQGRPGSHFRSLPAAITAAKAGDILLVLPGIYTWLPGPTAKPLTVQGVGSGVGIADQVQVAGLPGGGTFLLKNLSVVAVSVSNCAGAVVMSRLTRAYPSGLSSVVTRASRTVTLRQCSEVNLYSEDSFVQVQGGRLGYSGLRSVTPIQAVNSTVSITDAEVVGAVRWLSHSGPIAAMPAVIATNSRIWLRGRFARLATQAATSPAFGSSVIMGDAGSVLMQGDATTLIQATPGPAKVQGFGRVVRRALPTLRAGASAVLGQPWSYEIDSQPRTPFLVALGLPRAPMPAFGGFLHLNLGTLVVMNAGVQSASGSTAMSLVVNGSPALRGSLFVMQGVAGGPPVVTNAMSISVY